MFWRRKKRSGVYYYHDGQAEREGDPLGLMRELVTHPNDVRKCGEDFDSEDEIAQLNAAGKIAEATRAVFGISPMVEGGLTDAECVALYQDFNGWFE